MFLERLYHFMFLPAVHERSSVLTFLPAFGTVTIFHLFLWSLNLWTHGLQHTRIPCPSPSPRVCSNSCPLSWWCHSTISSSGAPFTSCPQSFPTSGSFSMHQLHIRWPKYWSFSFSISPSNEYSGLISFRIDWFDFLVVQGTLKSLSNSTVEKHAFFGAQPSLWSNSHIHTWLLVKP